MDMKKVLAVSAAIIGTAAMADGIVSSSVVGYVKRGTDVAANKFTMVTMPFSGVGDDVISIQDVITPVGVTAVSDADSLTDGAQLQVWTGSTYKMYYYINDGFDDDNDNLTGWGDAGEIVQTQYAPGTGFWFRYPKAAANYTLPGQVVDADSVSKNVYKSKFNMVGNPYPTLLNLKKITTTAPAVSDADSLSKGVQLQVWTGSTYKMYYYINDGFDDDHDNLTGWADAGEIVGVVGLDVSYGFWVKCLDSGAEADASGKVGVITFTL